MRTNYHTHTRWCDGKSTAEEVVLAAIEKGFGVLGFSSHVAFPEHEDWQLDPVCATDYAAEIRLLARRYADRLRILCGIEADYIRGVTAPDRSRYGVIAPDYVIGSVHTVIAPDGGRVSVDSAPALLADGIRAHFGGDAEAFVKAYFEQEREMIARCDFDVVGHPDLVRKFNAKHPYFDETAEWYVRELDLTAAAIAAAGKVTEVNTGAISRGWLDDAYPSAPFRDRLRVRGVRFILSSDSHAAEAVDCAFDRFGAVETYLDSPCEGGAAR